MAKELPARLTSREGRRFGLPVGGVLVLFAAVSAWRGHYWPPRLLAGAGLLLLLGGLLVPSRLGPVYRAWMGLAHALSKITTPIFLGVVYFGVMTPIGWLMRLLGKNPLRHSGPGGSYWMSPPSGGRSDLTIQF